MYQQDMRRLVALIIVIFAFAAVAGATTAHAHRYVSTPIVVLNHVDALNQPIPVVVHVQRGQIDLGTGITMPCGHHQAIPTSLPGVPPTMPDPRLWPELTAQAPIWTEPVPLRPPRHI